MGTLPGPGKIKRAAAVRLRGPAIAGVPAKREAAGMCHALGQKWREDTAAPFKGVRPSAFNGMGAASAAGPFEA